MRGRILFVIGALALTGCDRPGEPPPAAPLAVTLTGLAGESAPIERWRGQWLVINVWASWCEPCRREMGALQALSERVDPARAAVIGLTVDDDPNLAREYLRRAQIGFPNFTDVPSRAAGAVLGVKALPETLIVGPDGRVRERIVGARDWTDAALLARLGIPLAAAGSKRVPR